MVDGGVGAGKSTLMAPYAADALVAEVRVPLVSIH
jgi:hypothetical protein